MCPFVCRANAVFAVLAFVQSVMWLSQIADEVVALFQARSPVHHIALAATGNAGLLGALMSGSSHKTTHVQLKPKLSDQGCWIIANAASSVLSNGAMYTIQLPFPRHC